MDLLPNKKGMVYVLWGAAFFANFATCLYGIVQGVWLHAFLGGAAVGAVIGFVLFLIVQL